jgi:outer membrane protein
LIIKAETYLATALAALLLGTAVGPALSAPSEAQLSAYQAAPEDQRVRLLIQLAKSGRGEDAAYLLAHMPLEGPHAANRTLFVEGLILKSDRDLTGAAEKFRDALASDPGLTLVRSELAQTLVELDDNESAKHHLKLLASEAPTVEAAKGILSFIEQVDSRKPYKISGYVSLAPTSNANNGSEHDKVYVPMFGGYADIDPASKATSGLGMAAGLSAAYTKRLGNDFSFVASGGVDASLYTEPDFNSYGFSQSVELRRLFERGHIGFGAVASQSLDNKDYAPSYVSYGYRLSGALQLTQKDHLSASGIYEWRDTLSTHGIDSTALMVNGAWYHAFNSSFATTVFAGFDRNDTGVERTTMNNVWGGLSFYKELPKGITVNLTGKAYHVYFDAFDTSLGDTRVDNKIIGSIDLTKRDLNIFGFAPALNYSYTQNFSVSNLYDYKSHAVDFRLTKEF